MTKLPPLRLEPTSLLKKSIMASGHVRAVAVEVLVDDAVEVVDDDVETVVVVAVVVVEVTVLVVTVVVVVVVRVVVVVVVVEVEVEVDDMQWCTLKR